MKFRLMRVEMPPVAPVESVPIEPPPRFCPVCRQPVQHDAVICVNCGAHQGTGTQVPTEIGPAEAEVTAIPEPPIDPELLAELESLRSTATRWGRSIVILIISIAAFIALGILHFDLAFILLIVLIIFVHETGHLLAMITFRYRNLRMFFIPFFGAAVSGRGTDARGWKRAIVSLAGPVPGLFIGYGLLLMYVHTDEHLVGAAAAIFIALNAFNLLPLFPLDGGRFLNDVLFSRSRVLEALFRIGTALAILLLALLMSEWILAAFGVLLLTGAGRTWKRIALVSSLQKEIPLGPQTSADEIPPEIASRMADAVKQRMPRLNRTAWIAREVDEIWQRLHCRPPGALASLALLATYGASMLSVFVVPMVVLILIVVGSLPAPSSPVVSYTIAAFESGRSGGTDLHYAAAVGDEEFLNQIIADGSPLDAPDWHGRSPLIVAARYGKVESMKILIDRGADVNLVDQEGHTALMAAARHASPRGVRLLLDAGSDPATACDHGHTALNHAQQRDADDPERDRIIRDLKAALEHATSPPDGE